MWQSTTAQSLRRDIHRRQLLRATLHEQRDETHSLVVRERGRVVSSLAQIVLLR